MTVRELREVLNHADPEEVVKICVNTPGGWVCPDGCAIDIKAAYHGIDWHTCEILLVPLHQLDIHDVDEWSGKPKKEQKELKKKIRWQERATDKRPNHSRVHQVD